MHSTKTHILCNTSCTTKILCWLARTVKHREWKKLYQKPKKLIGDSNSEVIGEQTYSQLCILPVFLHLPLLSWEYSRAGAAAHCLPSACVLSAWLRPSTMYLQAIIHLSEWGVWPWCCCWVVLQYIPAFLAWSLRSKAALGINPSKAMRSRLFIIFRSRKAVQRRTRS